MNLFLRCRKLVTVSAEVTVLAALAFSAARAAGLATLAAEVGVHPATLAVAWVMGCHIAPVIPLISARDVAQLAPSLAAAGFVTEDGLRARLTALFPAPPPATDRIEEA